MGRGVFEGTGRTAYFTEVLANCDFCGDCVWLPEFRRAIAKNLVGCRFRGGVHAVLGNFVDAAQRLGCSRPKRKS